MGVLPRQAKAFQVKMPGQSREFGNLEFRTVELNVGGGWDQFAHQFRPPVPGLYVFHFVGYPLDRRTDSRLFIMHQANRIQFIHFGHDQHDSTSAHVILQLAAGDHVYVTIWKQALSMVEIGLILVAICWWQTISESFYKMVSD